MIAGTVALFFTVIAFLVALWFFLTIAGIVGLGLMLLGLVTLNVHTIAVGFAMFLVWRVCYA